MVELSQVAGFSASEQALHVVHAAHVHFKVQTKNSNFVYNNVFCIQLSFYFYLQLCGHANLEVTIQTFTQQWTFHIQKQGLLFQWVVGYDLLEQEGCIYNFVLSQTCTIWTATFAYACSIGEILQVPQYKFLNSKIQILKVKRIICMILRIIFSFIQQLKLNKIFCINFSKCNNSILKQQVSVYYQFSVNTFGCNNCVTNDQQQICKKQNQIQPFMNWLNAYIITKINYFGDVGPNIIGLDVCQ
eukprot:TRINITY_DN2448_c0_g2_i5.p2 TRINITY_DN2448_c0_g2~~TRINITY_DN2448_c0_g2_i5.p2  ORF type:complete len:244 (+),score=-11.35 TRINITY_DN2448_c0_g2_i5:98-829(+)